jgi:hypothetical protein
VKDPTTEHYYIFYKNIILGNGIQQLTIILMKELWCYTGNRIFVRFWIRMEGLLAIQPSGCELMVRSIGNLIIMAFRIVNSLQLHITRKALKTWLDNY